jgi:hypothetical protein
MWVRQAARLLLTCRRVFCQCQACHQNPRASSAQLVRASLLTSRSGVRASQGTFCLLSLSFGMLCATTQVASMSSMDLHLSWKVYVRNYTLRISFDFYKFWSILQGVPREISLDFCGLVSPLGLHSIFMDSRLLCKGYPSGLHYIFCDSWRVKHLDATRLHQGCDGTEIEYSATCNEGRDAAGSAWCPQSPGHGFPHIITSDS